MIPELYLSPEAIELKHTAAAFADQEIVPRAQEYWDSGEYPHELIAKISDLGWMSMLAPEEWGGGGSDTITYIAMLEELGRADITVALTVQVHVLCTDVYSQFASAAQKEEWMPRLVSGEILASIAMTEPGAGSDLRSLATTAKLDKGRWIINGQKVFITNAGTKTSDGMILLARTDANELSTFIVPTDAPGFIKGKKLRKLGWRAMDTRELFFENCEIPEENLLGARGKGLRHVLTGMDLGRIAFAACSTGLAQASFDYALAYSKEREQFGQPIGNFQSISFRLADMYTKIQAARSLTYTAARARDAGVANASTLASAAKLYASRVCVEVVDEAFQIYGGYGFMLEYPIARLYADAKMMEIGEGTSEMQRRTIAQFLGLS